MLTRRQFIHRSGTWACTGPSTCSGSQTGFEFRLEVFNLMNRTNFGAPNGNRSSTAFGTITSLATTPRQVQLGFKVNF